MQRNSRFGWLEGDLLIQQNPVSKGDFVGHPFRGNQWGDASGASFLSASESQQRGKLRQVGERKMIRHGTGHYETTNGLHFIQGTPPTRTWSVHASAEDRVALYETGESKLSSAVTDFERYQTETNQKMVYNDLNFNPFSPEAQNESEQDRRDERIEHRANAQVAYQDATRANLMLLHSLRGVGVVAVPDEFAIKGFRYENVIRLGGFDTTMHTKTNNIIHHSQATAEKQTKKVIAEMEQILSDPTLEVRALDENMWEYTFNHTLGNGTVRRATTRVTFRKPKDEADVSKGDPRMRLLKASTEAQFTLAPWYIPDKYDAQNEWTDAVELQKALWEYVKGGDREIRLQHNREIRAGEWVEAMTLPYEWSVPVHKANGEVGSHTYPKGTVLLGVVWDDWAWDMVKKGDITGFSIGGSAERIDLEMPT